MFQGRGEGVFVACTCSISKESLDGDKPQGDVKAVVRTLLALASSYLKQAAHFGLAGQLFDDAVALPDPAAIEQAKLQQKADAASWLQWHGPTSAIWSYCLSLHSCAISFVSHFVSLWCRLASIAMMLSQRLLVLWGKPRIPVETWMHTSLCFHQSPALTILHLHIFLLYT